MVNIPTFLKITLSLGQGAKRLIHNLLSESNENMNEHVSPMQNHLPPDDMTAALSWLGLVLYSHTTTVRYSIIIIILTPNT